MATVHASPYSGTWYSGDPGELKDLLGELFERSRARTGDCVRPDALGFVVPHAGLVYSGGVAAAAYRHVREQNPERIVILGFAHRGGPPGMSIPDVDAISTPLGESRLDRSLAEELFAGGAFRKVREYAVCDHSVEIQLPLLQAAAPHARILPIYVGESDAATRREAARALAGITGAGTVMLASSDFTHYGHDFHFRPFPPDVHVSEKLRELDESVIEAAGSLDSELFLQALRTSGSNVCGSAPISLLLDTMAVARCDEVFQETLDYQTSGEITADFRHSVSYASLGYFPADTFALGAEDRKLLLESARSTLDRLQRTGERKPVYPVRRTPGLSMRAGIFVSLHIKGELRGCVGTRGKDQDLYSAAPEMALSAALDDVRFRPLDAGEAGLEIEISVLTPMKRIARQDLLQVGVHGAYLEARYNRGLLLPQVASARDWNAKQFLAALARKAGASHGVYSEPSSRLFVFRAQRFGDDLVS